jgi:lipoprotein-anchoring transpeptidase ErfK/SrfK
LRFSAAFSWLFSLILKLSQGLLRATAYIPIQIAPDRAVDAVASLTRNVSAMPHHCQSHSANLFAFNARHRGTPPAFTPVAGHGGAAMKAPAVNTLVGITVAQALMLVWLMTPAAAQTRQIVFSIPDHKLALIEDGEVIRVFPVATGRDETPSPTGTFKMVNRVTLPTTIRVKRSNQGH